VRSFLEGTLSQRRLELKHNAKRIPCHTFENMFRLKHV